MFLCNMFKTILEAFTTTGDFDDEIRLIYCKLIAKTEDVPVPQETVPQLDDLSFLITSFNDMSIVSTIEATPQPITRRPRLMMDAVS